MYPDSRDVWLVTQRLGIAADADKIWPDVALMRAFLNFARHCCYNHGKHGYTPVAEIKALTEQWIGHTVDATAFSLGAMLTDARFRGKQTRQMKFPQVARLSEYRQQWAEELQSTEAEIKEEQTRLLQNRF